MFDSDLTLTGSTLVWSIDYANTNLEPFISSTINLFYLCCGLPSQTSKNSKMMNIINYRLRITLSDSRVLTGQMLAFDKHMNLVLSDCEEFRKVKSKGKVPEGQAEHEEKRTLGLVILRGETIVSMSIDGPPPPSTEEKTSRASQLMTGPGVGRVSLT